MSFEVKVYSRILTYLHDRLRTVPKIQEYAYEGTEYASKKFASYFKETYLSGNPIKVKSGRLKRSVKPAVRVHGKSIKGGISWGGPHIPYALVHVNNYAGMETVITPRKRKFLAVPVGANADKSLFSSPLDMPYSILRGSAIGMYEGRSFVPYFVLRKQVILLSKVGINSVMESYKPIFMKDVMSVVKDRIRREKK